MSQENDALKAARLELENRFNKTVGVASSNLCTHCGWCVDQCHYYLATKDPTISPVAKAERVRRVYKRRHDWMSRIFPFWTGAKELTEEELDAWVEIAYRNCTLCDRCMANCPLAVDTAQILLAARGVLLAAGTAPEMLVQLADAAIAREENLDFFKEFYLEQLKELETEVQNRLGDDKARIPVDVEGAKILYVPLSGAHTITPPATVFDAVGESWTISMFEAANYATYVGDIPKAKRIAERILKEAERLKVEEIVWLWFSCLEILVLSQHRRPAAQPRGRAFCLAKSIHIGLLGLFTCLQIRGILEIEDASDEKDRLFPQRNSTGHAGFCVGPAPADASDWVLARAGAISATPARSAQAPAHHRGVSSGDGVPPAGDGPLAPDRTTPAGRGGSPAATGRLGLAYAGRRAGHPGEKPGQLRSMLCLCRHWQH